MHLRQPQTNGEAVQYTSTPSSRCRVLAIIHARQNNHRSFCSSAGSRHKCMRPRCPNLVWRNLEYVSPASPPFQFISILCLQHHRESRLHSGRWIHSEYVHFVRICIYYRVLIARLFLLLSLDQPRKSELGGTYNSLRRCLPWLLGCRHLSAQQSLRHVRRPQSSLS